MFKTSIKIIFAFLFTFLFTKNLLGQNVDSVVTKEYFLYNAFGDISETTFQINNGPINKTKVIFPSDLGSHIYPMVDSLLRYRFYNLPIFKITSRNDTVITANFFEYEKNARGLLKKLFIARVAEENLGSFNFQNEMSSNNPSVQLVGASYQLESTVDLYNSSGQPLQITERNGVKKSMLYDEEGRVIATATNAKFSDIAYYYWDDEVSYFNPRNLSQFGNWIITSGTKNTFTKNNLDPSKTYVVSMMGSSPNYTIQGGTVLKTFSRQLYAYKIHTIYVKGSSSLTVTLNSGGINNLRIFPRESLMDNINYGINNTVVAQIGPNFDIQSAGYDYWDRPTYETTNFLLNDKFYSYSEGNFQSSVVEENWDSTKKITLYDPLGRVNQIIDNFALDSYRKTIFKYDNINRLTKTFDPFVVIDPAFSNPVLSANFVTDTVEQIRFYKDSLKNPNSDYNLHPYSRYRYDNYTNEIIEKEGTGPFFKFVNAAIPYSGHTEKFNKKRYSRLSRNYPLKYWSYDKTGLKFKAVHRENVLLVQTIKGPNWTSGKANTVALFSNDKGNLIVKKEYLSEVDSAVTFYLYDKLDRLVFVIPPGTALADISYTHTDFKNLIYTYKYDKYNQVIEKKLPGKGIEYYVYNNDGSIAATQDSILRAERKWMIFKYDAHGRLLKSIQHNYVSTRQSLQTIIFNQTIPWEQKQEIGTYDYTSRVFPQTGGTELTVNYYDEYETNIPTDCLWRIPKVSTNMRTSENAAPLGKPTASKVKILGQNKYLWSVAFYESCSRNIRTVSDNIVGGSDEIINTYSSYLRHNVVASKKYVHRNAIDSIVSLVNYEYDSSFRIVGITNKINNQVVQNLIKNYYDKTGKINYSLIGGNSVNDFAYKVSPKYDYVSRVKSLKGLLKNGSTLFESSYAFDNAAKNDFRGNISSVTHKLNNNAVQQQRSNYTYDAFNRLKVAATSLGSVADNGYKEYFNYDIVGNIISASRYAKVTGAVQQVDSLKYYYDGFKHTRIDDISTSVAAVKALGFSESVQVASEYVFDGNGRAIKDLNKGISYIHYNIANLPDTIKFSNNNLLTYVYDVNGEKLSKHFKVGTTTTNTYYAGGAEYYSTNTGVKNLRLFNFGGGEVRPNGSAYDYLYHITNQVGSPLMTLSVNSVTNTYLVTQTNSYYAYGNAAPYSEGNLVSGTKYNYLYGGKELQEETQWYDHGARMYDATIGKWNVPDPLAASFENVSPYNHSNNNPVNFTDPTGLAPVFQNGGWDQYENVPSWVKNDLIQYDRDVYNGIKQMVYDNRQSGWDSYNSKVDGFNASLRSVGFNNVFLPIADVRGFSNFASFLRNVETIATLAYTAYENGAKFDTYTNPSNGHLYGENPYGAYMGPQNANEWETFGDVLGSTEIPLVAQLGDAISLGANVYQGDGGGVLMSVAAFIPFGSQFKLAAKTSTTALRKVGSVLESVDDVMASPNLLKGKSPLQVEGILGKTPGWRIETLGQGSQKGNGWVLRQYNAKGNPTGPQLRWHPGGGHHGPTPYWRVVGSNGDLGGIIR